MQSRNSSLMLFDPKPIQTDVKEYTDVTITSTTDPKANPTSPIEFVIPGNAKTYLDLVQTYLYLKVKVTKGDGTKVEAADKVGLTNLPMASLFSDVYLSVNDAQIEGGAGFYPYKGYLSTVMNMHPAAQKSHLQSTGWYKDEAGKLDDDTNAGFKKRQALINESKPFELMGPLYLDLFRQNKYLLAGTSLRLKLLRSKPEFALMGHSATSTSFKIHIESAKMIVRHLEVNESVINGHKAGLLKQNILYPIQRTNFRSFTIAKGSQGEEKPDLFPDSTPRLVLIAMVDNDAFHGTLAKNPYNFKHNDLSKIVLMRNGQPFPGHVYEPNFDEKLTLRSYVNTMMAMDYFNTDDTNGLTPDEFRNGFTIYAFDMTADNQVVAPHRQAKKRESVSLQIAFKNALPATINVLVLSLSDAKVELTHKGSVITDYPR